MSTQNEIIPDDSQSNSKGGFQKRVNQFCLTVEAFCESLSSIPSKSRLISERSRKLQRLKFRAQNAVNVEELDKDATFEKMCAEILVENFGKVSQWKSGMQAYIQASVFDYIDEHPLAEEIPTSDIQEIFVLAGQKVIAGKIEQLEKELTFTKAKQRWGLPAPPAAPDKNINS